MAGLVVDIAARGEAVPNTLIGELVDAVLARNEVRLALRLAAGEEPRLALALRLAEVVSRGELRRDESEVG